MKGIVYKLPGVGLLAGGQTVFKNGQWVQTQRPISDESFNNWKKTVPEKVRQAGRRIASEYLKKGGFIYGADLWKYKIVREKYRATAFIYITFEDDANEGKEILTQRIKQTGISRIGAQLVKNYSTI